MTAPIAEESSSRKSESSHIPRMLAAQVTEFNHPYTIREIDRPSLHDPANCSLLLIKVLVFSLCHSDLQILDGEYPVRLPITGGHEVVGEIVEIGELVQGNKWTRGLRMCESCQHLKPQFCALKTAGFIGISNGKGKLIESGNGGFAEYILADPQWTVVLPDPLAADDELGLASACMCAGATAYGALREAHLSTGDWVAVVGIGGLGTMGVQLAKAMGVNVVAVDPKSEALDAVRHTKNGEVKADICSAETGDTLRAELLKRCPSALRPDQTDIKAAVVFTDSVDAFETAVDIVGFEGTVVAVGLPQQPLRVSAQALVYKRVRCIGSLHCNRKELDEMLDLVVKHDIDLHVQYHKFENINGVVQMSREGTILGRAAFQL